MNRAVYVIDTGCDGDAWCEMGVCALEDVPEKSVFTLSSPDVDEIFSAARRTIGCVEHAEGVGIVVPGYFVAYNESARKIAEHIRKVTDGAVYEIVKAR